MALIPPPRSHLVRWARCYASNNTLRKVITLKPYVNYEIPARGSPKYTDVSLDFEINQLNAFDEPTIYLD